MGASPDLVDAAANVLNSHIFLAAFSIEQSPNLLLYLIRHVCTAHGGNTSCDGELAHLVHKRCKLRFVKHIILVHVSLLESLHHLCHAFSRDTLIVGSFLVCTNFCLLSSAQRCEPLKSDLANIVKMFRHSLCVFS